MNTSRQNRIATMETARSHLEAAITVLDDSRHKWAERIILEKVRDALSDCNQLLTEWEGDSQP